MPELHANPLSRGADLAVLIDLEARWENLRATRTSATPYSLQELQRNQRAYDLFHTKLVAIATRTNRACASRPAPGDVRSAARELEMLAVWCTDSLAVIDAAR
jgi:hypothetical protein